MTKPHHFIQTLSRFGLLITLVAGFAEFANAKCEHTSHYQFGIVPIAKASVTEVWMQNINQLLENEACISFSFSSAKNFKHYIKKAERDQFDFIAAPPHIASYLISKADMTPMAELVWESSYVYITRNDKNISSLDALNNTKIALPDPLSELSILVKRELSPRYDDIEYVHLRSIHSIFSKLMHEEV